MFNFNKMFDINTQSHSKLLFTLQSKGIPIVPDPGST